MLHLGYWTRLRIVTYCLFITSLHLIPTIIRNSYAKEILFIGLCKKLLSEGYIEVALEFLHVCSPLSIVTNQSGKRGWW